MAAMRTIEGFLTGARGRDAVNGLHDANGSNGHASNGRHTNGNGHRPDVWDELRREIERSRRYGRSFALVRIGRISTRTLSGTLRAIDREWAADGATYVLLPEAVRAQAESLVTRLALEAPDVVGGCTVSVAAFPEDGLTSGALLKQLRAAAAPADSMHQASLRVSPLPAVHA